MCMEIHLSEDMRFGSSLNDISCFHSEDYLQILKKFIRNLQNPVLQVANRISDISYAVRLKRNLITFHQDRKIIVFIG